MNLKDIKIMLIKGQKGDKGADGYDDTELRQMIADEAAAREAEIAQMETNYLDYMYPVGSIYMSVGNTSPAVLFGGTWAKIEGQFLLASSNSHENGTTGGAETKNYTPAGTVQGHTLTGTEMPNHSHGETTFYHGTTGSPTETYKIQEASSGTANYSYKSNAKTGNMYDDDAGGVAVVGGNPHSHGFQGTQASINVMPPYLAVNVWKRTA